MLTAPIEIGGEENKEIRGGGGGHTSKQNIGLTSQDFSPHL